MLFSSNLLVGKCNVLYLDTAPLPTSAPLTDDNSILDSLMKACCVVRLFLL